MTTSNSSDLAGTATESTANAPEIVQKETVTPEPAAASEKSAFDNLKSAAKTDPVITADAPAAPVIPADPAKPAYNPNYKFKAFGKEHELEEFWRGLIKDADSEKKVKDLFTKSFAFEDTKARYESTQEEYQGLLTDHQALDKDVKRVMKFRNDGDYENFFRSLRIPDQEIFNYVEQKLQRANMPPDQQRAFDQQSLERQRQYDLETEKSDLEQQYQTQAVQHRAMQLDWVLNRPDVSQAASQWDQKLGKLGAFKEAVIAEAKTAWFAEQLDLSAEDATQRVIQKYGAFLNGSAPQAPMPGNAAPVISLAPQAQETKPVIPIIKGQGVSPIKKAPKTLDDLKKMSREAQDSA